MKTNKKLTNTILLSSLVIAAFGSVAAGTTYALFTSKAESSITVTTGKVSVSQEVEIKECYTPTLINEDGTIADETNAYDEATGFEVSVTGNDVAISKMLPGDKVTLTVTPKNDSNVKIKYRETYSVTGDENSVLSITGENNMITHWTALEANGTIEAYEISIEVPATVTKGVEDAKITLGLEAVQSNAKVYDVEVSTKEDLVEALKSSKESLSINITENIELDSTFSVTAKNLTIFGGEGENKLKLSANDKRVFNIFGDDNPYLSGGSLTLYGIDLVANKGTDAEARAINVYSTKNYTVTLDNCNVSANHYALNIAAQNENTNVIVRNSTLTGYAAIQTYSPNTNATFDTCTLIGVNTWSGSTDDFATIVFGASASNSKMSFKNCTIEANHSGTASEKFLDVQGSTTYASNAVVTFENCKFYDNGDDVTNKVNDNLEDYFDIQNDTTLTIK